MSETPNPYGPGWRAIERYVYVNRPYPAVSAWLADHLDAIGTPLPDGDRALELRISPAGRVLRRPVRLRIGKLTSGERRASAAIGWTDAHRPHLFPRLDGLVEAAPVSNDVRPFTQLGVTARYRPPFGPFGGLGDRLLGAEIVDVALTGFLDQLAQAVEEHVDAPSLEPGAVSFHSTGGAAGCRRIFLTVDGLAVRRGGAVAACDSLAGTPGVAALAIDPWTGLARVDYDPGRCDTPQLVSALGQEILEPAGS